MLSVKNQTTFIEEVSLESLAEQYGTPLFVYSEAHIKEQFHKLVNCFKAAGMDSPLIAYACKANDRLAVLDLIANLGGGIDIVSGGELQKALASGIDPQNIIFSGIGKKIDELTLAVERQIRQINIETVQGLDHIQEVCTSLNQPMNVMFRLNPDVEAGTHDKISTGRGEDKFGLSAETILELYQTSAKMPLINPIGISIHIGSQVADPRYYIPAFQKLSALVEEIRSLGCEVRALDLGGGLGITYRDEPEADLEAYARIIKEIIAPLGCHLSLEPGRFLVGNAGILLSRVLTVKKTEAKTHVIIDAAMNDLIRPTLYEAWHTIKPVKCTDRPYHTYDVVGPVCESGDTFAKDRFLPELQDDDLVYVESVGAYGSVMSSYYNARPPAAEIWVSKEGHSLIYRPPSIEEIIDREKTFLRS